MEQTQILKDVGFSDKFLEALQEFEKEIPNIYYEVPFMDQNKILQAIDNGGDMIIDRENVSYNQNFILTEI